MKKAEFIKTWCDAVDKGRVKNYPDMRPSERAVEAVADQEKAEKLWRKYRAHYAAISRAQFQAELATPSKQ